MVDKCESMAGIFDLFAGLNRLLMRSKFVKDQKLSKMEFFIILILGTHDDMSMSSLAEKVGTSKEQASRLVNSLEKEGLVAREVNEKNRRMVNVRLTSQGEKFKKNRERELFEVLVDELEGLSQEDFQELFQHIGAITSILEKVLINKR